MTSRWRELLRLALAPRERGAAFSVIVTLVFAALLAWVHFHHEAWRDEVHCWSVGRNSAGLWDLITGDRRYDGHPFLWYYVIYLTSQLAHGMLGLHLLAVAQSSAAAYLWLRCSGAPRLVRLLLLPSYLFFYEYGVVARSYMLGALLLFVFCALYRREHVRYGRLASVLVLVALTSVYGSIISGALALFLFTRGLRLCQPDGSGSWRLLTTRPGYGRGLAIYVFGVLLTALSTLPPADNMWAPTWNTSVGLEPLSKGFANLWRASVPTNLDWGSARYLGSDIPWLQPLTPWLGAALFATWLGALRRAPMLAVSFALGAVGMAYFGHAKYQAYLRHMGCTFLLLLACAWLLRRELKPGQSMRLMWTSLGLCLAVQLQGGLASSVADVLRTFSGALDAARFLTSRFPERTLIIGGQDFMAAAVSGYADRAFLFADTGDYGQSVISHDRRRRWLSSQDVLTLAHNHLQTRARVVLVTSFLLRDVGPRLRLDLQYTSGPAIVGTDRYFIYEARLASPH